MKNAKRIVAAVLSATMMCNNIPISVFAEEYSYDVWDGSITTDWITATSGTEDDPYIIDSSSDLAGLAQLTLDSTYNGFKDKHFEITANLDLNNLPWLSIGGSDKATMTNSKINFAAISSSQSYLSDYVGNGTNSESLYKIKNECFLGIAKVNATSLSSIDMAKINTKQQFVPLLFTPDNKVYISAYKKDITGEFYVNSLNIGDRTFTYYTNENNHNIGIHEVPVSLFALNIDKNTGVCSSLPQSKTFNFIYNYKTGEETSDYETHKITLNNNGSWDYFDDTSSITNINDTSPYWISLDGTETHIATSEDEIEWVKNSISLSNPFEFTLSDFNAKTTIYTDYIDAYFSYNIVNDDGSEIVEFNGNIDGKNARIKNLKSATSIYEDTDPNYYGEDYIHGLFGLIGNDATVENFVIENATIETMTTDYNQIGVGSVFSTVNKGTLNNIHVLSCEYPSTYTSLMGGITGINFGTIKNSYFACETTAQDGNASSYMPCGGIAGYNAINGLIDSCVSNMTTPAKYDAVGGIAGLNEGTITNCENIGTHYNKDGAESCSGGIVGVNGLDGIVENCTNNGILGDRTININDLGDSAGIAGRNLGQIKKCLNKADVIGNSAAGIVVNNCCGVIEDCINIAKIWGCYDLPNCAAGIASTMLSGTIRNCHNFGELYNDTDKYRAGGAGGIAGVFEKNNYEKQITIENCNNYGDVYGYSYGAGIAVGDYMFTQSKKYIKNCNNYGNISSTYSTFYGGVIAAASCAEIENCNSYGNLSVKDSEISPDSCGDTVFYGGFASQIRNSTVKNCIVVGDLWCPDNRTVINCAGFVVRTQDSSFINCGVVDANHNTPVRLNNSSVYSFVSQNYDCEFTDCFADIAMQYDLNPDYYIASGFAQANSNNIFKNCYSKITNLINLPPKNDEGFLGSWNTGMEVRNCFYLNIEGLLPLGGAYNPTNPDGTSALDEVYTFEEGDHLNGALAYRLDKGSEANRTTNWTVVGEHQIVIDETIGDFNFQKTINIPSYTGFATETYKPVYKQTIGTVTGNGVLASTGLANSIADATDEVVYLRAEDSTKFTHTTQAPNVLYGFTYGNDIPVPDNFTMPASDIVLNVEYKPLYNITIENSANGTTTVDKNTAFEGDTVTITASADTNYILKALKYNNIDVDITGNTYTFTMPAEDVVVDATYKNTEKYISEFILAGETATISGTNINITIPYDIDISDIAPDSIVYKGDSISPDVNDKHDFTENVQYTITAEDGSTITYNVNVSRSIVYGNITINLTTEDNIVDGRKFEATGSDNNKYPIIVDENGTATITVPLYTIDGTPITYKVTEIDKPVRYENATEQNVNFAQNTAVNTFNNSLDRQNLTINYTNEDSVYDVEAIVTVTSSEGYNETVELSGNTAQLNNLLVYNSNDELITYTVTQTNAPVRYTGNVSENATLETANPTISLHNVLNKCDIIVNVVKDNTTPFANVKVTLSIGNTVIAEAYSDRNGYCEFNDLPVYNAQNAKISYTVEQITVDDKYLKPQKKTLELDLHTDASVVLNNIHNIGTLTLKLTTEDSIVNNRKFAITVGNISYDVTTNDNGEVSIELPMKDANGRNITYKVSAVDTPIRYHETAYSTFDFGNEKTYTINVANTLKKADLTIKYSAEDEVYNDSITATVTGSDGYSNTISITGNVHTIVGLPIYDSNDQFIMYTVTQTNKPIRYTENATGATTIDVVRPTISLYNELCRSDIIVNVVKDTSTPFENVEIQLLNGTTVLQSLHSDISGKCVFSNYPVYDSNNSKITYTVKQITEDSSYLKPDNVDLELTYGINSSVTLNNIYNIGELKIQLSTEDNIVNNREFEVHSCNGNHSSTTNCHIIKTDANGYATIKLLMKNTDGTPISYKVVESNIPVRYGDAVEKNFDFTNSSDVTLTFTDTLDRANLEINYSNEDNNYDSEIKVTITGTNGYSNTISFDGQSYTVNNLIVYDENNEYITYTVSQDNADVRYILADDESVELKVANTEVNLYNSLKKSSVTVTVTDNNGNVLSNVPVNVLYNGSIITTVETNKNGVAVFNNLPVYNTNNEKIEYEVCQKTAVTNYLIPSAKSTKLSEDTTTNVTLINVYNLQKIEIQLNAEDGDNDNRKINIAVSDGKTTLYRSLVTDENGKAEILVPKYNDSTSQALSFKIIEDEKPIKYGPAETFIPVFDNGVAVVKITDKLIRNDISIIYESEDNNKTAEFKITSSDNYINNVSITDKFIKVTDLRVYDKNNNIIEYTVEQINTPVRYELTSAQTYDIINERSYKFYNALKTNNLTINYTSEDSDKNAEFEVTGSNGYKNTVSTTTGNIVLSDLLVYDENNNAIVYTVSQLNTPVKYKTSVAQTATIEDGAIINVTNVLKRNDLTIIYKSEDNNKNAEFKVTGTGYNNTVSTTTGSVTISDLRVYDANNNLITYTIEQINGSIKYEVSAIQTAIVKEDATVIFSDTLKKNNIIVIHDSEDDNTTAEFEITGSNGYKNTVITENGSVTIPNLVIYDTNNTLVVYTIKQVNIPIRYIATEAQSISLDNNNQISVYNTLKKNDLVIKYSAEDANKTAEFKITGTNNYVNIVTTDTEEVVISNLPVYDKDNNPIKYTVEQLNVPVRYNDVSSETLEIVDDNTVTFTNTLKKHSITIIYNSDDNNASAKFSITGTNNYTNEVYTDNGIVKVLDLPVYDSNNNLIIYTVEQLNQPIRYETSAVQTTDVQEDAILTFADTVKKGSLIIKPTFRTEFIDIKNLTANVELTSSDGKSQIVSVEDSYIFSNLPIYDSANNTITYQARIVDIYDGSNNVTDDYMTFATQATKLEYNDTVTLTLDNIYNYCDLQLDFKTGKDIIEFVGANIEIIGSDGFTLSTSTTDITNVFKLKVFDDNGNKIKYMITCEPVNRQQTFNNNQLNIEAASGEIMIYTIDVKATTGNLQVIINPEDEKSNDYTIIVNGDDGSQYIIENATNDTVFENLNVFNNNDEKIIYEVTVKSNDARYLVIDELKSDITLNEFDTVTVNYDAVNKYSNMTIILKDSENKPIANGSFNISINNNVLLSIKTDASGCTEINDLPIYDEDGEKLVYQISQVGSDVGYDLAVDQFASLNEETETVVEFINDKQVIGDSTPIVPEEPTNPDTGIRITLFMPLLSAAVMTVTSIRTKKKK